VSFYREVERLGWRWVGRVRGRDDIKLKYRWRSCKNIFKEATTTPSWSMRSGRRVNGSRVTMMRCSLDDRGAVGFVGIPQGTSPFSARPRFPPPSAIRLA
jgi:hypothetical protein